MNKYKLTCDDDLQLKIAQSRSKNELISKTLIRVFGKFEEFLSQINNGRGVFKSEHETLNQQYAATLDTIEHPRTGLLKKLRDTQTRVRLGMVPGDQQGIENEREWKGPDQTISQEDMRDLFKVLKDQQESMKVLVDAVKASTRTLHAIEKEIANVQ